MRRWLLCKTAAIKGVIKDLDEVAEDEELSLNEIKCITSDAHKIIEQICKL